MRWRSYLLVSAILILLSTSFGLADVNLTVTVNPEWIVANGSSSSIITVNVTESGIPISGANILFSVNDSRLGFVNPESTQTDMGIATTVFTTKTVSGTARINVSVNGTQANYSIVEIDHGTPYRMLVEYSNTAEVGINLPIHVHLEDRFGNPVDNRRNAEQIHFMMACPDPLSKFFGSWEYIEYNTTNVELPVDGKGNVNISINLSTIPNDHLVMIDPLVPISDKYISIKSLAIGIPYYIHQMVDPPNPDPYIPADNISNGSINYTVFDKYWNPMQGKIINVASYGVTNPGGLGSHQLVTTETGSVVMQVGPTTIEDMITFNATVEENQSATSEITFDFYDNKPTTLLLTVNPNSMVSYDVSNSSIALITAAITDIHGEGIPDQKVDFSIVNVQFDGTYNITSNPYILAPAFNNTDNGGYAAGYFIPGGFATDPEAPNYSYSATGTADIMANWRDPSGIDHTVVTPIKWKNSPLISVYTLISKSELIIGDEVDVTLLVKADGPQLQSRPIDVILAMGRDIGMLDNRQQFIKDPILSTRPAARMFNSFMTPNYDKVGLITFGDKGNADLIQNKAIKRSYLVGDDGPQGNDDVSVVTANYTGNGRTYGSYVTQDMDLTGNIPLVNQEVDKIVPFNEEKSGSGDGIPLRKALYDSTNDLIAHGRPNAVKAIIALVDQGFNWYGDPLARGSGETDCSEGNIEKGNPSNQWIAFPCGGPYTGHWDIANGNNDWQNMGNYARDNNIKIFVVSYTDSVSADRQSELDTLAATTGGFHRHAADEQDLIDIYAEIGELLRKEAAVNASANMNFTQVRLNNITYPGSAVFDYVYYEDKSTVTHRWNKTYDHYENWSQLEDWSDYILTFPIGTLYVNDTWLANFTLRVNKTGTISFPYSPSDVSFEGTGGGDSVLIPVAILGSGQQSNPQEVSVDTLVLNDFRWTNSNPATDVIQLAWQYDYNGNQTVREDIYYFVKGSNIPRLIPRDAVRMNNGAAMYISDLIPSEEYSFRLCVSVPSKPNTQISVNPGIKCPGLPNCACTGPVSIVTSGQIILK